MAHHAGAGPGGGQGRRAVIIGGSMGGVFAALYLKKQGWDVHVYERSPVPLVGRGAGIVTHPELRQALADVGRAADSDLGVAFDWRITLDREGREIARLKRPQITTSWNRLYSIMNEVLVPDYYHLGKELVSLEQDERTVTAHFADGSHASGVLLIGADGFRSQVRAHLLPDAQPIYAGYIAWRGLAEEARFSPATRAQVIETFAFHLPPGEQIIGYPAAGPNNEIAPGQRCWNIVWYRPTDAATLARFLTDGKGHKHAMSIPPPLIAPDVVAAMRADAERTLPPQFAEAIRIIDQPFFQPIYDFETPRMAVGRVALIGDAAFVVRPHVGAGVVKVANDAEALTRALAGSADVTAALRAFEAERQPMGRRFVAHVRRLGSYIRREFASEAERKAALAFAQPAAVMADTAVLDFLAREAA